MTLKLPPPAPLPEPDVAHFASGAPWYFTKDAMRAHAAAERRAVLMAVAEWLETDWMLSIQHAAELRAAMEQSNG